MLWCFIKLPQFSTRIFDRNSVFFKTVPLFFCCVVQSDLEDQSNELRNAEDQAKKAIVDAARLADELRQEQDHASQIEKMRRTLENQVSVFRLSSLPCDFLFFFYCESCIVGQYPRWRFSAGVYVIRLFICFSTRYIKTRRSLHHQTQKYSTIIPGNPFILGSKGQRSRSRATKTLPTWVFSRLGVLAFSRFICNHKYDDISSSNGRKCVLTEQTFF